ncbi:MAG: hypothetical protein HZB09_00525 [Candidatus Yonathbacteria bacterium]|nr:hypothetical protein [Candidatus Yonathbacteria bacterium]
MTSHRYKFFISPVIIFSLVFSSFAFIPTKRADAALDVGAVTAAAVAAGLACLASGLLPSLGSLTSVPVNDKTQNNKTCAADTLAFALGKVVLASLTDSIVNWAQNGFPDGGPSYAKDLNKTMRTVADGEIANFFSSLTGVNICDPANFNFLLSLSKIKTGGPKYACTLTKAIANVEKFQKDFESGGWIAYQESMAPQNNPIGFAIKASGEVSSKTQNKKNSLQQELGWGKGFLSFKDADGNTLTPNTVIESSTNDSLKSVARQLELADSINKILIAITDALAKKAFASAKGLFN